MKKTLPVCIKTMIDQHDGIPSKESGKPGEKNKCILLDWSGTLLFEAREIAPLSVGATSPISEHVVKIK